MDLRSTVSDDHQKRGMSFTTSDIMFGSEFGVEKPRGTSVPSDFANPMRIQTEVMRQTWNTRGWKFDTRAIPGYEKDQRRAEMKRTGKAHKGRILVNWYVNLHYPETRDVIWWRTWKMSYDTPNTNNEHDPYLRVNPCRPEIGIGNVFDA